jgi:hypothetical protein
VWPRGQIEREAGTRVKGFIPGMAGMTGLAVWPRIIVSVWPACSHAPFLLDNRTRQPGALNRLWFCGRVRWETSGLGPRRSSLSGGGHAGALTADWRTILPPSRQPVILIVP